MTTDVVVSGDVEVQIGEIDRWWREHRPAAPELFVEELAAGFDLLASAPYAGRRYTHFRVREVRRILLRSTGYHVYYTVRDKVVVVLAVWSASRGVGPDLSRLV